MPCSTIYLSSGDNKVSHVTETLRFNLVWFQRPQRDETCSVWKSAETVRGHEDRGGLSAVQEWIVFWLSPTEPCNLNFTDPEADVEILQRSDSAAECNYLVTVYLGYGIEVQVSIQGFLVDISTIGNEQRKISLYFRKQQPVLITPATLADRQLQDQLTQSNMSVCLVTILSNVFLFHLCILPSQIHKG